MSHNEHPNRKAVCPECGKLITAYVPSAHVESMDGPKRYIFRSHKGVFGRVECFMWAARVPDDAFMDDKPNVDSEARRV